MATQSSGNERIVINPGTNTAHGTATAHGTKCGPVPRTSWLSLFAIATVLAACEADPHTVPSPPFDEVFALAGTVELAESPTDSVAQIGMFRERRAGGFLISDRLLPRIRRYSEDGALEAAFGSFGDGPWEFRRMGGFAETTSGHVVVANWRNSWLSYLTPALTPDTIVPVPGLAVFGVEAFADGVILYGVRSVVLATMGGREERGHLHRLVADSIAWSAWTSRTDDKPYWNGLGGGRSVTIAGDSIFVMEPLLYPATILNGAGDSVGTIGYPSPSFRQIPEIPRGYFAGEQSGSRVREVLRSYDLVRRINVVADDYLVFTIGRPDPAKPTFPFRKMDTAVEVYDRRSGEKLYRDVDLPEGSKVLGGGRYLYVLLDPDFPPWRIAKYRLLAED